MICGCRLRGGRFRGGRLGEEDVGFRLRVDSAVVEWVVQVANTACTG